MIAAKSQMESISSSFFLHVSNGSWTEVQIPHPSLSLDCGEWTEPTRNARLYVRLSPGSGPTQPIVVLNHNITMGD